MYFIFFTNKCWVSVTFALAENLFKPRMKVIDRTKEVTQQTVDIFWFSWDS